MGRLGEREAGEFNSTLRYICKWLLCVPQQKLKEDRESRRASLDARHQYICSMLGMKLGVEDSEVEEYLLDENQVCNFDRVRA